MLRISRQYIFALVLIVSCVAAADDRPNIIFIIADDLGWNDVSFHGSDQIPTPNLDALAFNGVVLNNHYVPPICTPSRSALMTGKYPIHTGMQGLPLLAAEPRGLPLDVKIMPQYLKELGYTTRAVGKWHLGFYKKEYTPAYRGFDSHLGYWAGFISYYDYILQDQYASGPYNGYDMHRNLSVAYDLAGQYATDLFTDESVRIINNHDSRTPLFLYLAHLAAHSGNKGKFLEAPQEVINRFSYIADPNRRSYAAMVSKLDESVGRVVEALQENRMLHNSIIVFLSDNGAPTIGMYPNWGSNYPLRGLKETLWEGGVRNAGLIWSPLLQQTPRISNQLMHMTDWLPTIYSAAGGDLGRLAYPMDGTDHWASLVYNLDSPRNEILLNIDEKIRHAAIRRDNWKLVIGSVGHGAYDGYFGDSGVDYANPHYNITGVVSSLAGRAIANAFSQSLIYHAPTSEAEVPLLRQFATLHCEENNVNNPPCDPTAVGTACLYDIRSDPCERNNLALVNTNVVRYLRKLLAQYRLTMRPQSNMKPDAFTADPKKFNNSWTYWADPFYG